MAKKVVFLVHTQGNEKKKVMQTVASIPGIDNISTSTDGKKVTVAAVGNMDPIALGNKLKKQWRTEMIKMGPVKEEKTNKEIKSRKEMIGLLEKTHQRKIVVYEERYHVKKK